VKAPGADKTNQQSAREQSRAGITTNWGGRNRCALPKPGGKGSLREGGEGVIRMRKKKGREGGINSLRHVGRKEINLTGKTQEARYLPVEWPITSPTRFVKGRKSPGTFSLKRSLSGARSGKCQHSRP